MSSPDSDSFTGSDSKRGEGDEPLWRIGRGSRVPLQGAVDMVPLQGAIVVCYGWGGLTTKLGKWTWRHCSVLWWGGWGGGRRPTLGEWTWCHCRVPLQGANFCFISSSFFQGQPLSPRHPRKQQ